MGIALLAVSTLAHPLTFLHRWWSLRAAPLPPQCKQPSTPTLGRAPGMPSPRTEQAMASSGSKAVSCAHLGVPVRPAGPVPITAPRPARAADIRGLHPARHRRLDKPFPLRVLHTHGNGRMAIAGSMAEVCAELDRLAANELRH